MSKNSKNYPWLNTRPNSAKTLIEKAKREVPEFREHFAKPACRQAGSRHL